METKELKCKCEHKEQDELVGNYTRIHNKMTRNSTKDEWRCTACGDVKDRGK